MAKKIESLILGIMCFLLTIGMCLQIKTVNNNGTTISTNQEEAELRSQVLKMKERYQASYERLEIVDKELETTRTEVASSNESLKLLEEKIKNVNSLLGLTEVTGQGVSITISDAPATIKSLTPEDLIVHNTDLLCIVNELKNAGAEAIEINGQRIVRTSSITCEGNVIMVNGERVSSPFVINAIGLPELLSTLNRPQGYLDILSQYNIKTTLKKVESITIPKYSGIMTLKYVNAET